MQLRNYQANSEEVQEILGRIPHWIIRFGIVIISCLVLILITCSSVITLPNVLRTSVIIASDQQPFRVLLPATDKKLYRVEVKDSQAVKAGDVLLSRYEDGREVTRQKTPIAGTISFIHNYEGNTQVSTLLVCPPKGEFDVILQIKESGFGKVKIGQKIYINLEAYPGEEFGNLEGYISTISQAQQDGSHIAQAKLNSGFTTSRNIVLSPGYRMSGEAEIVLEEVSLFRRVFDTIL